MRISDWSSDVGSSDLRDDPTPFVRALSGDSNSYALAGALREEILDGIRQLGFDPDDTALSNDEQDAIDLVGILFQSLVQANELMQRARTMYANRSLRNLRSALPDNSFSTAPTPPPRRCSEGPPAPCAATAARPRQAPHMPHRPHTAVTPGVPTQADAVGYG